MLKKLVAEIESGEKAINELYVLYQIPAAERGYVGRFSDDTGLSAHSEAVLWLEAEKWRILNAAPWSPTDG